MPPKGKKGKKGKKMPVLIDGVDTSSMTRDQLEAFALRLKAEMDREREERNYFQLERDKIRTFWDITRNQLEEARVELREKDKEVEVTQDLADIETKDVMQKMKFLQFENHAKIGEVRAEAITQLKLAQENHVLQELELLRDKRDLRRIIRESVELADMQVREMERKLNDKMIQERLEFEKERKNDNSLHDQRMREQKEKIVLFYRTQMFEVVERKNSQVKALQDHHDLAFVKMKNYYNDITLNNLALISSLKKELETLRIHTDRSERLANEAQNEARRLRDPLEHATVQLRDHRRQLQFYERDKQQLARLKPRNSYLEQRVTNLTWETEALVLRNNELVKERDALKQHFGEVFMELQQKTGLKNALLERKVLAMLKEDEKRQIIMQETLATCKPDLQAQLVNIEDRVEKAVEKKSKTINDLRYELARTKKSHDDMIVTYECKLERMGVPKMELGFETTQKSEKSQKYLCGPAGLATKNK